MNKTGTNYFTKMKQGISCSTNHKNPNSTLPQIRNTKTLNNLKMNLPLIKKRKINKEKELETVFILYIIGEIRA